MKFERRGNLFLPKHILRRRYIEAFIEPPAFRLSGHLVVELIDAATGFVKRRLAFDNLIVNGALDALGNAAATVAGLQPGFVGGMTAYAGCGTGSTAPAVTDAALVAEIAPTTTNRSNSIGGGTEAHSYNASPEYMERTIVREFSISQANGNLTEIGFFTANSGGTMWMRQLFKDGTGTPTTIVKTSSDILRVTYKIRCHPPSSDATNSIVISGSSYTWTLRPLGTSTFTQWGDGGTFFGILAGTFMIGNTSTGHASGFETNTLAARTATTLGGSASPCSSTTWASYVNGNFFRDMTNVWGTNQGNFASGLGGIEIFNPDHQGGTSRIFQEVFSPKFPKDNTKQLTLVHRFSWGRYP